MNMRRNMLAATLLAGLGMTGVVMAGNPCQLNAGTSGGSTASGSVETACGRYNTASGNESGAFGLKNHAVGNYSNAFGYNNIVRGDSSSAFGSYAVVEVHSDYSIVLGAGRNYADGVTVADNITSAIA